MGLLVPTSKSTARSDAGEGAVLGGAYGAGQVVGWRRAGVGATDPERNAMHTIHIGRQAVKGAAVGVGIGAAVRAASRRRQRQVSKSSQLRARGSNGKFASSNHGYQSVSVEVRGNSKPIAGDRKERSHSVGRRLR